MFSQAQACVNTLFLGQLTQVHRNTFHCRCLSLEHCEESLRSNSYVFPSTGMCKHSY